MSTNTQKNSNDSDHAGFHISYGAEVRDVNPLKPQLIYGHNKFQQTGKRKTCLWIVMLDDIFIYEEGCVLQLQVSTGWDQSASAQCFNQCQIQENPRENYLIFSGKNWESQWFESGAAGCKAQTLPMCYAMHPPPNF